MGVLISNRINSSSTSTEGLISTSYVHSVSNDSSGNAVINKMNVDGTMTVDLVPVNQSKLDPYVSYDSSLDRVVSVKPLATTLSSFYLKEQHSVSSGYENIFFKNLQTDVAWQPCWSGIKMPQTLEENRGDDGIYKPTARIYTTDVQEIERFGGYIPDAEVDFDEYSYFENKNSVYGLDCILAEDVGTEIQMKFIVRKNDRDVYEQLLPIQSYFKNQTLKINFSIPLESHGQEYITIFLCKVRISDDVDLGFLKVRPALETDGLGQVKVYAKLYLRFFEDKLLAFKDDILDASGNNLVDIENRLTILENAHDHNHTSEPENEPDDHEARIADLEAKVLELQNQMSGILGIFSSD